MGRSAKKISDFDVRLGRVVKSKRVKAEHTRASLAAETGIPESNIKRREEGVNEITVSELERIAVIVDVPAAELVEEALADYGGMEKLLAEHAIADGVVDDKTIDGVSDPADNVSYLGRVNVPQRVAAKKRAKPTE